MNTLDLYALASKLTQAGAIGARLGVLSGALPAIRLLAVSGVREHFQSQRSPDGSPWKPLSRPRPSGGDTPLRDKGRLLASVMARVTGLNVELVASHPGANVHQYGATIRPRLAKMLALPLTSEAARVGSPRQNHFPRPLFAYRREAGKNLFLAERAEGNKLVLQYLLRREVRVPARPYLGFSRATLAKIERVLSNRLADWVAKAFGAPPPSAGPYGVAL